MDLIHIASSTEGLEVGCQNSQKFSPELEKLRSELEYYEKLLGYCKMNEKLKVDMVVKEKEVQCLRKLNEELKAKCDELEINCKKQIEELHVKHEEQNGEQELRYKKKNEELHCKYKDLQSKYEKQKEELQAKLEDLQSSVKKQDELQAKYKNQQEEMQAQGIVLIKNTLEILQKQIDAKRKQLRQLEGLYSIMELPLTQLEDGKRIPNSLYDEGEWAEKSGGHGKAYDERLKIFEMEAAKLDAEIQIKMGNLGEMLEHEKFSGELGSAAVWKSIQTNMELQDIREELIRGLEGQKTGWTAIGIKRMGELVTFPFLNDCYKKYGISNHKNKADELLSQCQEEIKNPNWHPFKIIKQANNKIKEVINDDDAKLKHLRITYGNDVCHAVKTALVELNESNASGRETVPELWNFKKSRKATILEVLKYRFEQCRCTTYSTSASTRNKSDAKKE